MTTTQTHTELPAADQVQPPPTKRISARLTRPGPALLGAVEHLVLAAIAYVPLLVVKPGVETSDTKTYLYLDPGKFLHQVASMWDPSVALGTVTHEYIGYLLPMGPFYWFFSVIGVPTWVAQRIWLGTILFAAGAGVLLLGRTLRLRAPGRTVAAFAFMLSPYVLQYAGRISVILLPWAGLPFMVAFTARALRQRGWRYPALFALVVAFTSGINASSIIYVAFAPALWLLFAVAVEHECSWRHAGATALKMVVLTFGVCLWWIAGLVVEAGYGVDVLRYTETLPATTETSSAAEVIRGLGYWYFYGSDRLGPWTQSAVMYTQQLWLLAVSYLVPVLSFVAAAIVRWRYRAYFVGLVVVGVVLSVGAHPYSNPTPLGGLLKRFMSATTAGFALRSTDRATPLVILGLAVLLGSGISAIRQRLPVLGFVVAMGALAAVIADNPALFNGDAAVVSFFTQPATLPAYEMSAVSHLNSTHRGTRVLAIPGNDFASFRWGDTVDTPQPAYLTRPFVTREQQVMGSIATADTLFAIDDPIQTGTEQWNSLAPMARLLSAGDVLVEYDQRYEHYGTPHPQLLAQQLSQTPEGLSDPMSFGTPRPNTPSYPTTDGQDLVPLDPLPNPPPLVDYTVDNPRPVSRAESDSGAMIVAGDATGLEDLSDAGLLNTDSAIYYSGTLDTDPTLLHQLVTNGAALVVTDTNRKQAFRWDTLTANYGEIETPSQNPAKTDPSDSPIDLFPGAPASSKTTASYTGAVDVTASSYGNSVSYTPEDRPYNAVDQNLDTAWTTGTFVPNPSGQWWQLSLPGPVTADHISFTQPQSGDRSRWITRVTLTFDGAHPFTTDLGPSSRSASGEAVSFPARTFRTFRVTIDETSNDHMTTTAASAVGFAEIGLPGVQVAEVIQMPSDILDAVGASSIHNRLTIDMSRERVAATSFPYRSDPQTNISREFSLPTARTFTISGSASLSSLVPDDEIDRLVGRPGSDGSGVVAYSEGRLPGDLNAGASAAVDGSLSTAWQPGFGAAFQKGEWLHYDLPSPVTFDHLDLEVVADGLHSVPTSLSISTENATRSVTLPPIADTPRAGATQLVPVTFPALTGSHITVTITGVRLESSTNFNSTTPVALPLGIAELGIPGVQVPPDPASLPGGCQSNLLYIDGKPISVSIQGSTGAALAGGEVSVVPCGPDASGITLGPGNHVVETAIGHSPSTGWNIDQLVLDSAPGGGPAPAAAFGSLPSVQPGPAPAVSVASETTTSQQMTVTGANAPFELVLGQSINSGWKAAASAVAGGKARSVDLGAPELVDAFANGWQLTSADLARLGIPTGDTGAAGVGARSGSTFTVTLTWAPQRNVWTALVVSAAMIVLCLVLVFVPTGLIRRRRDRQRLGRRSVASSPAPAAGHAGSRSGREGRVRAFGLRDLAVRARHTPSESSLSSRVLSTISAVFAVVLTIRRAILRARSHPEAVTGVGPQTMATAPDAAPRPTEATDAEVPTGSQVARPLPQSPVLTLPVSSGGRLPRVWVIAVASTLTGVVAGAIVSVPIGAAAAGATAAALCVRWLRPILSLGAVGLLVAAAVSVVGGQSMHLIPESSNWPSAYESAALLVWIAVVALGADAVVTTARLKRNPPGKPGGEVADTSAADGTEAAHGSLS